jgi:hypothetical protein
MPIRLRHLILAALLLIAALPAGAHASPGQAMTFEAPRELLADPSGTLDEIKGFGVTQVRQLVYWRSFAPSPVARRKPGFDATDPAAYGAAWAPLDRLFDAAQARGIQVNLTLTGPVPRWATSTKRKGDYVTKPSPREFGRFAQAVAKRYGDRVSVWSIWNEPNQPQFLMPQYVKGKPASPRIYRRLYLAAYDAIRSVPSNAKDQILLGETSPRGNDHIVFPMDFLRGTLCLDSRYRKAGSCGRLPADGYAHHAYTTSQGPRWRPPNGGDVTIGVLSRLIRGLDRAAAAGAIPKRLPVFLTEFGIQSYPDKLSGVSPARQAAYMAIAEHMAYVNPRVAAFSQYLMRDDAPKGRIFPGFESGLRYHDGAAKPAYDAFRLPLAIDNYGRNDVAWGMVRPFRQQTTVTLEQRAGGRWQEVQTKRTSTKGVYGFSIRHRKGSRYRIAWTAPNGTRYTGPAISVHG